MRWRHSIGRAETVAGGTRSKDTEGAMIHRKEFRVLCDTHSEAMSTHPKRHYPVLFLTSVAVVNADKNQFRRGKSLFLAYGLKSIVDRSLGLGGPCSPAKFQGLPKTLVIYFQSLNRPPSKASWVFSSCRPGWNVSIQRKWLHKNLTALPVGFGTPSSFYDTMKWTESCMVLQYPSCNPYLFWPCSETNKNCDFILVSVFQCCLRTINLILHLMT